MTKKTTVFISYNHKDSILRDQFLEIVNRDEYSRSINVKYDKALKRAPQDLFGTISKMLNKSHVVVAIITDNWLNSHNTRDEFIRSHERRKTLYCISDKNCNKELIPHFIKNDLRYEFEDSSFENSIKDVLNSILLYDEHWFLSCTDYLRKIGDVLQSEHKKENKRQFVIKQLENRLKRGSKIIEDVVKDSFNISVNSEENFLKMANPYFELANEIYAVSHIVVSTFWNDTNTPHPVKKNYLKAHNLNQIPGKKVFRLFVFQNPAQLNNYKNILQANYNEYGRSKSSGNVLICSEYNYDKLLFKWFFGNQDKIMQQKLFDFGIMKYPNDYTMEASLTKGNIEVRKIDLEDTEFQSREEFITDLQKSSDELRAYGVFNWKDSYYDDKDSLKNLLKSVFSTDKQDYETIHSVLFKVRGEDLSSFCELINRLLSVLYTNKKEYGFLAAYFKERNNSAPRVFNPLNGSSLIVTGEFNFFLSMRFENDQKLGIYYNDPFHQKIRRELYVMFEPLSNTHYKKIDALKLQKQRHETQMSMEELENIESKIISEYTAIEKMIIGKHALRMDWKEINTIDSIIQRKGYQFSNLNK